MANKTFNTRIKNKRDTAANWEAVATTFQPLDGELIIVDTAAGKTRFKVGRYDTAKGRLLYYNEIPFTDEYLYNDLNESQGKIYDKLKGIDDKSIIEMTLEHSTGTAALKHYSIGIWQFPKTGFYKIKLSQLGTNITFLHLYARKTKDDGTLPEEDFSNDNLVMTSGAGGDGQLEYIYVLADYLDTDSLTAYKIQFLNPILRQGITWVNTYDKTTQKWSFISAANVNAKNVSNTLTLTKGDTTTIYNGSVAREVSIPTKISELTNDSNFTTQTDLDNLTNTVVSYNAQENITDEQKSQARTNIGAISSSELVQSDWNQNDETAKDYIKNRICYTKDATEITVLNSILPFTDISSSGLTVFSYQDTSSNIKFNEGTTYTVNFDTTSYTCIAFTDDRLSNAVILGNLGIAGMSSATNEPFAIVTDNKGDNGLQIVTNLTGTSHNVKIAESYTEIVKLDKKYIPDDIFINIENIDNKVEDFINNTQFLTKTDSVGTGSFSFNRETGSTVGKNSATFGLNNIASGDNAFAEGAINKATGWASHAEGNVTTASGNDAHAEGSGTKATGASSHAEGLDTIASGNYSHTEGENTTAENKWSHAEGKDTNTKGLASHAEGIKTIAQGNFSHAEGRFTVALGENQHVEGILNIEDTTSLHIVGNGTYTESSGQKTKSNAHTLDKLGNAWFAGNVYVGSTSGTNKDDGSKKLATEEYVNNKTTTITVDDTLSDTSTNPVQNKVVKAAIDDLQASIDSKPSAADAVYTATAASTDGVAYTATVSGIDSLTVGASFIMIPNKASTSKAPTLNVNGLGAKPIRRRLSSLTTSLQQGYSTNWIALNKPFTVVYDGTAWVIEGLTKTDGADVYGAVAQATADAKGNNIADTYATIAMLQSLLPKVTTITLTSNWVGDASPYYQDIALSCVTETSIVDLQPTPEQLNSWQDDGIAFTTLSGNGTVRVYVAGGKPSSAISVQVRVQEVTVI